MLISHTPHPYPFLSSVSLLLLFLDLLSWALSRTECTITPALSLGADRQRLVTCTGLWLLGVEAVVAVAVAVAGVTWWVG